MASVAVSVLAWPLSAQTRVPTGWRVFVTVSRNPVAPGQDGCADISVRVTDSAGRNGILIQPEAGSQNVLGRDFLLALDVETPAPFKLSGDPSRGWQTLCPLTADTAKSGWLVAAYPRPDLGPNARARDIAFEVAVPIFIGRTGGGSDVVEPPIEAPSGIASAPAAPAPAAGSSPPTATPVNAGGNSPASVGVPASAPGSSWQPSPPPTSRIAQRNRSAKLGRIAQIAIAAFPLAKAAAQKAFRKGPPDKAAMVERLASAGRLELGDLAYEIGADEPTGATEEYFAALALVVGAAKGTFGVFVPVEEGTEPDLAARRAQRIWATLAAVGARADKLTPDGLVPPALLGTVSEVKLGRAKPVLVRVP